MGNSLINNNAVEYSYEGNVIAQVPVELSFIIESIKKSEYILDLEDDFDDNGSQKYAKSTWLSSIEFLINYSNSLYDTFNVIIEKPKIYNGPNSSIDILWENEKYTFLININKNGLDASFYAENNSNTQSIKGQFKLNEYFNSFIPFAVKIKK